MGQAEDRLRFDLLDDHQESQLNAIRWRIEPSSNDFLEAGTGDQVIKILESWLLDDEQKQHLAANTWDIFFLYAAAGLLNLKDADGANNSAGITAPINTSETALSPEPVKPSCRHLNISSGSKPTFWN